MKDGTIWTRMVCYYSLANQWAWKEKDSQESLIKGEDPERQDIEQQNSSHQALQGETPLISPPAPGWCGSWWARDRVKVKCGLIIIDNPSRDPGHSDCVVISKEIWNQSIFEMSDSDRMLTGKSKKKGPSSKSPLLLILRLEMKWVELG